MIVVTGATGQLGSLVVGQLLQRVPAERVALSVRDPEKAAGPAALGVRVRRGDYAEPETLTAAFEGAEQVLVVSSNSAGDGAVAQHAAALQAARDAGARRVLYTSHQAAGPASAFDPMRDHAATHALLADLGVPTTALRNGFYAATVPVLLGAALQTGELAAPADGPVSWTAHVDLAEATAVVLADEGRLDGVSPPLTAPVTLDLADVAALLTELTGSPVRRVVQSDDEWLAGMVGRGVPAAQAQMLLGLFVAARRGEFDVTDPTLEELLGRPATPLRTVLAAAVAR